MKNLRDFLRSPLAISLFFVLLMYGPRLARPFIWDEVGTISYDAGLERPFSWRSYLTKEYFGFSNEQSWRPLSTLTYQVSNSLFGKCSWPPRLLTLILHAANALLLVWLGAALALPPAAAYAAAAVFALHPSHVEVLSCSAFNKEPLVLFGLLVMLWAHKNRRSALAATALGWAVLSKETGVIGVPAAILFDLCRGEDIKKRFRDYALYGVVTLGYLWVRFVGLPGPGGRGSCSAAFRERMFFGIESWVSFWRIFVWPVGLRIDYFALPASSVKEWLVWGIAAAVVTLVIVLALRRWWRSEVVFGLGWAILFYIPTSAVLPFGLLTTRYQAERWLYIPYAGLCLALGTL